MMRDSSITVVLPLYNHERYIEAALLSILEQSSPANEIILIDDGSIDDGYVRAQKIFGGHSNVILLKQKNIGAHATLNKGIEQAKCEYIAVLNTDDLFLPSKLERCRELIRDNPRTELIAGGVTLIDDEGFEMRSGEAVEWLQKAITYKQGCNTIDLGLLNENYVVSTSNMVFSRELWARCDGFQNLRYCHDLDFILTALCKSDVIIDIHNTHIKYRIHQKNTIKENIKNIRLEIAAVMANALLSSSHRLFDNKHKNLNLIQLYSIIKAKQNAELLCTLLSMRYSCNSRSEFYELLFSSSLLSELKEVIM
jgi:glycosyltransferase involved in cell wall biosynthesis